MIRHNRCHPNHNDLVGVFEQNSEPGGMLICGIPRFRVDKDMVRREIRRLEEAGIRIITNAKIDPSLDEIHKDYDRIVIAADKQLSIVILDNIPLNLFRNHPHIRENVVCAVKAVVINASHINNNKKYQQSETYNPTAGIMTLSSLEPMPHPIKEIRFNLP